MKRMVDVREALRTPALALWWLYIVTSPLYILPSGLPQPGDVLVFVLIPAALLGWDGRLNTELVRSLRPLIWFTAWVCVVSLTWAAISGLWLSRKAYTIFPIYYSYNTAIFAVAFILYQRVGEVFLRITMHAIYASVFVQVLGTFVIGTDFRTAVFFNNANQLGYYALTAASMMALTQRRLGTGLFTASIGFIACAYLAMLSASRAAVGGIAILFFLLVFSNPKVIIVASLAAVGVLTIGGPITRSIDALEQRMDRGRGRFMEERGYDRMWKYPQHLVFGAGEGEVARFVDNPKFAREIHSSFATVLFAYGVVGMTLFMLFLYRVVRGALLRRSLMLLPIAAFSLSHQGLRFTLLWIMLAVFVATKVPAPASARRATNDARPARAEEAPA